VDRVTPAETVRKLAGPIGKLGGAFMFDAATFARGAELGMDPWAFYHCGRGGVLGNPDPSVVVAAFGFFPPALQTKAWNKGVAVLDPATTAHHYAQACVEDGRTRFAVEGAERLADLLTRALDAADVAGLPLFAGWRAALHAGPADGPARLALALMAGREHRGGCHLVAVRAAGIAPLQAVMSGRNGAANAEFFGWPQPWPDPALAADAMAAAEATTDRLVQPAFEVLSADERAELVTGLRAL
jgi:hypothetical protein